MGAIETEGRIEFCFCQNYSHFFSKIETQKKDVHNLKKDLFFFFSIIIRLLFFKIKKSFSEHIFVEMSSFSWGAKECNLSEYKKHKSH